MITLWDVEGGLPQLDKYLYSNDQAVVAGALLGVGIVNSNVRVCDPQSRLSACTLAWYHTEVEVHIDSSGWSHVHQAEHGRTRQHLR